MHQLTRTLVYQGTEQWIDECLMRRGIKEVHYINPTTKIIETQCVKEKLSEPSQGELAKEAYSRWLKLNTEGQHIFSRAIEGEAP